jgi:hypothetical protein
VPRGTQSRLRHKRLGTQPLDGAEVFDIGGWHSQGMFQRSGGNERIAQLYAVRQRIGINQLHRAIRDGSADRHNQCYDALLPVSGGAQKRRRGLLGR